MRKIDIQDLVQLLGMLGIKCTISGRFCWLHTPIMGLEFRYYIQSVFEY